MAQAKRGDQVKVHYTGRLADGQIFDSSAGSEPLEFTIGEGNLIGGFEEAVVGMTPGESKSAEIAAVQAYGPHRQDLVMVVERQQIPPVHSTGSRPAFGATPRRQRKFCGNGD